MPPHPLSGVWVPLFDDLSEPRVVAGLAAEAEAAGWHGFFVWDRLSWPTPVDRVADPWICLAAVATVTESLRLGPMVTPLARRRPVKLARETASLDRLCGGRLTLGVGLGSDVYGAELARTGEQVDDRVRAEMLDEALHVLTCAWSGRPVRHRGAHYLVDDLTLLPTPVQQPRVPIWTAGYAGRRRPLHRAARYDGLVPVELAHPDQLAEMAALISGLRVDPTAPFDLAVPLPPGADPAPYVAAGATWCLTDFDPEDLSIDRVRAVVRDGPGVRPQLEVARR